MAKTAKIILSLFTFFLAGGLVYAVTKDGEISTSGNRYNDSCGITLPEPKGYVNDFYGLFGAEEKYFLDSMIGAFEKETTN